MPLPSVLLHDHLDGGLRVGTILELADKQSYRELPSEDHDELAKWFDQSGAGSLERYLAAFDHTVALMQDRESLQRVAYEAVLDLAADGVVYVEQRFRPNHFVRGGLSPVEVVDAVASGMRLGSAETGIAWGLIVCALRHLDDSLQEASTAVASRHLGVVGFDLAGPEHGFPPKRHLQAFRLARESGLRVTIHAGESGRERGVAYVASAMDSCGAERLGHGIELIDDCVVVAGDIVELGPVARRVRDRRIALEMCPSSNQATKGLKPDRHPLGMMHRAGFNVTISTDNRLMSNTTMSAELELARAHHDLDVTDLALIARRSLAAAFCDHETKVRLWEGSIAASYTAAGADVDSRWR